MSERKPLSFGATLLASGLGVLIVMLLGGLLMLICTIGMVAGISAMGKEKPVVVRPHSVLEVNLGRIAGDRTASGLAQAFGNGHTVGLLDAASAIRQAADDPNIQALYLTDPGISTLSWGSMTELRDALADFRTSEKPIIAYATSYTQGGYYLCSVADQVLLHPAGMVDFRGIGAEVMFYKDMLDKLGVEVQLIRPESCTYKSAGEVYTMNHMSSENREQIRAYIGSIWRTVTAQIAADRQVEVAELQRVADRLEGYLAPDAVSSRLVDSLCFEQDVRDYLRTQCDGKVLVGIEKYARQANKQLPSASSDAIAVIYAEGNVMDGSNRGLATGVYGDDIVQALKKATDNEQVKAIVLRVNSPGGAATASESMTHAVMAARAKKPVIVSMGDLAASAGYEMSCMADCIVAQPTTITGSIGVFGTIPNVNRLMRQKLGLATDTVSTNAQSASLGIYRPLSPSARALMNRNVEDFYRTFVGRVAEGRHMDYDAVHRIARGRVWTGVEAQRIGLVDTLGGFDVALNIAAERAGLTHYRLLRYPEEKDVWSQLSSLVGDESTDDLTLRSKVRLALRWRNGHDLQAPLGGYEQVLQTISEKSSLQARLPFEILAM